MNLLDMFRSGTVSNAANVDPFDHPEVMRMSLRELADLPWPRHEPDQGTSPREEPVDNSDVNTFCV
jgi:hypothetical protein